MIHFLQADGKYRDAVKFVIHIKECGLKPEVYSYLIAMTSVVKELQEFAKAWCKLKSFSSAGLISELDAENTKLIQKYQDDLIEDGVLLANWALKEGSSPSVDGLVHERLLVMYICAGCGVEAERELWEMKLVGKEAEGVLYDVVLAICASQKESGAVGRLLTRIELTSRLGRKKSLSWLLRGYIKGGHFENAAETVMKMLDLGFYPEYVDRRAVLQGLKKRIQQAGILGTYLQLCNQLSNANLIVPCLVYLHIKKHKLWIIKMI